jgi:hypothetical protein
MRKLCLLALTLPLLGQSPAPRAVEENLTPEQFQQVHAPLLQPKRDGAAGVTERVAAALPAPKGARISHTRANFVDDHIFGKMERDGVKPAAVASDHEFLRRVMLDLTGRIPSAEEVRAFAASTDPRKRARKIDELLETEAYVDRFAYFFMDLFRANGKMGRGQNLFHYWTRENLRVDRPYDDAVRDIIASRAKSNHVVAASNIIAREHVQGKPQPDDGKDLGMVHQLDTHDELNVLYAKTFLGVNLSCVSCHDGKGHLEKVNVYLSGKKRTEFYQNASFLGRSRYLMYWEDGKPQSGEFLIDDGNPGYDTKGASMIRVARFGGKGDPAFFLTGETARPGEEPSEALGRMITSHPQFARATVNLFWWRLMGQGIVEPYDDFDLARQDPKNLPAGWELQPSHPELLDALAADFRKNGYRLKHLLRTITNSTTYQLSARYDGEWHDRYSKYFARKFVRLLGAEELHDSLTLATGRAGSFKFNDTQVQMAMQLSGPSGGGDLKYFMQTFGQSNRNNPPKLLNGSPLQPLVMMQSPVVTERVLAQKDSRVQRLLESYPEDSRVVEEMFLGTLSRPPSGEEREIALAALRKNRVEGAQNLQWALVNMTEFFYNY